MLQYVISTHRLARGYNTVTLISLGTTEAQLQDLQCKNFQKNASFPLLEGGGGGEFLSYNIYYIIYKKGEGRVTDALLRPRF